MKRLWLGVLCMLLSGALLASGVDAVRKQVQASMLVTGTLVVATDGSVQSYVVDHPDQLPPAVVNLVGHNVPNWRFEPVVRDGQPVLAKAAMTLRVVAKPEGGDKYELNIAGSHFGRQASSDNTGHESISYKRRTGIIYPAIAAREGVSGTVYLLLRVNRQGLVDESAAEQINLGVVGNDREMQQYRKQLADAALKAARYWTFNPPTSGPDARKPFWLVMVPVEFELKRHSQILLADKYGHWKAYVPGPRNIPAWEVKSESGGSADAIAAGGLYEVGQGLQLKTPLNGA